MLIHQKKERKEEDDKEKKDEKREKRTPQNHLQSLRIHVYLYFYISIIVDSSIKKVRLRKTICEKRRKVKNKN